MIRRTLFILGITAVVTGLASTSNAQSPNSSSPNNSSVTISGQSLRSVENRSISNDFQTFFSETSQGGEYPVQTNVGRLTQPRSNNPLGDGLEVVVGDTLDPTTPFTFPNGGYTNEGGQVRVQINQ